ncbi:YitT family protein [Bacillus inaquosorum]|uniref:YczE/YyaS/YitT family protein n=1 Tax=Bacillus inaquosorum TaxID=483913 RepID=UPI002281537E|nr:YitT family protein [Bacillus inaquosorum]MCY8028866.1 YitT family protein [Bacillus inaquosorum]MCY8070232.1 YitT family protein [Bacillus inaquosorum]MCY8238445.1 YitT family protein [Bacillus inaquosorum]MCY8786736.1 YitT family protein [Bacillus inaquosorum]MCY8850720.1 YitT family protein [Bacillus inaquosorum]
MKYIYYSLGILILSLGISLTIQSGLGTSPFDAVLVGLSEEVGLTVGSWEVLISVILLICNSILTRKKPMLLGLITAFITGIGIDLWLFIVKTTISPNMWVSKLICFGIGLVLIGLGTAIYLQTKFASTPIDHLTLIIRDISKRTILFSRTLVYALFLVLAIIFKGPIGIGTLLTVCLGGMILHFFMPFVERRFLSSKM